MAKWKKETTDDRKAPNRSLKKRLAVATVAASLGMSLGVPVQEILAQDAGVSNPPGYTVKDRMNEEMDQLEAATSDQENAETVDMTKESSVQLKWDKQSSQDKWNVGSNQGKWDGASIQDKWTQGNIQNKINSDINAEGVNVSK